MISESRIKEIVNEEITKSDEKKIRAIVADCVEDLFHSLWIKKSYWSNDVKK